MPGTARVVIPGCAYHVTRRGNNRQDVFFADEGRRAGVRAGKDNEDDTEAQ